MSDLRMPDLNSVIIAGRVTRDPELKYTSGNKPFLKLSIANSRRFKTDDGYQEQSTFVDVTVFGAMAEYVAKGTAKGHAVIVEGRLSQSEWTDKDGARRTKLEVIASRVVPLEWHGSAKDGARPQAATQEPPRATQAAPPPRQPDDSRGNFVEDDLPF